MAENDMHKMKKTDLLTMLYKQEKKIENLSDEVNDLEIEIKNKDEKIDKTNEILDKSLELNKMLKKSANKDKSNEEKSSSKNSANGKRSLRLKTDKKDTAQKQQNEKADNDEILDKYKEKLKEHEIVNLDLKANLDSAKKSSNKLRKEIIDAENKDNDDKNEDVSLDALGNEIEKRKKNENRIVFIRMTICFVIVVIAIAIIIASNFFQVLQVTGNSMEPTLYEGELLITSKYFKYEKGDLISFYYNDNVFIKRVIATEGEEVVIDEDGLVYVDGNKLEENYVKEYSYGKCDITFPYKVPNNCVFVLGDNRNVSTDSRDLSIGSVSEDKIIGKIKFKIYPFKIY